MDSGGQDITHLHSIEKNEKTESRAQSDSSGVKEAGTTTERPNGFPLNERTGTKIPHGFGKLIRDESGAVVDVLLESEMHEDSESGEGAAVELELDDFEIARQPGSSGSDWLLRNRRGGNNEVLRALEDASKGDTKVVRESSSAEIKYLSRLVEAHGEDYEAMAKDGKRNVSQYTSGQLRRAIAKAKAKA
ncbi:ribosome biogenesis protein Nop16-domain-containing protein [Phellopilus nigrolimitatus]|nr:ribosome biogenesis protein Nop16-domain-containing protein [Phellopilus nigrolimitatus]